MQKTKFPPLPEDIIRISESGCLKLEYSFQFRDENSNVKSPQQIIDIKNSNQASQEVHYQCNKYQINEINVSVDAKANLINLYKKQELNGYIEANANLIGTYKKQILDSIGSRWYYHVNSQMALLNIGTVEIRFQITPDGKVKATRVLSNSSNESFASVCLASICQADIPPVPPEIVGLLESGHLEIDYSFAIIDNR